MSPLMNMTLFFLFPHLRGSGAIGCDARIDKPLHNENAFFLAGKGGPRRTLVWVMEQLQAVIKVVDTPERWTL